MSPLLKAISILYHKSYTIACYTSCKVLTALFVNACILVAEFWSKWFVEAEKTYCETEKTEM